MEMWEVGMYVEELCRYTISPAEVPNFTKTGTQMDGAGSTDGRSRNRVYC